MQVSIELSDGTILMWSLDFSEEDTDPDAAEDATYESIVKIIGQPDSMQL